MLSNPYQQGSCAEKRPAVVEGQNLLAAIKFKRKKSLFRDPLLVRTEPRLGSIFLDRFSRIGSGPILDAVNNVTCGQRAEIS